MKTELSILQHGIEWDGQDVSGYYASEKLDGCRAFWTGREMLSRSGRVIHAPERITRQLPAGVAIDGELYAGVGGFNLTSIAARYHRFDPRVRFIAFDAPEIPGDWHQRMLYVWQLNLECVNVLPVPDMAAMITTLRGIEAKGGEGLMLHRPGIPYRSGRFDELLKIKPYMLLDLFSTCSIFGGNNSG